LAEGQESEDLSEHDVLTREVADDLRTALERFSAIAGELEG
jgi:hypothetical protein